MADILVVDCGNALGIRSVLAFLAGLRVEAVSSVDELQQHLRDATIVTPCAVLCITCSRRDEGRSPVDETLRTVRSKPALVIDEQFDDDFARLLLERGALDYLDMTNLCPAELHRHIDWAILRNGHRSSAPNIRDVHLATNARDDRAETQRILDSVPPRERQVLDLYLAGMAPKRIARQLRTSPKTVWNQLANLRRRFDVASNHALCLLALELMPNENARE